MWFIGVEVEQETSAPPPKKNPGSAPVQLSQATPPGGWRGGGSTILNLVIFTRFA